MTPNLKRAFSLGVGALALVLGAGSALAQAPVGPAPYFQSFSNLQLGRAQESPMAQTFQVGHAQVTFTGTWAPILKDGKLHGYFMQGRGGLSYGSAYAAEAPVFTRNLKDWTGATAQTTPKGLLYADYRFTRARLRFAGVPAPTWTGSETGTLEAPYQAFQKTWSTVDGFPAHHRFAQQEGGPANRPVVVLEMEGSDLNLVYELDAVDTFSERLAVMKNFHAPGFLKDAANLITLSKQPVGYDPRAGSVPIRYSIRDLDVDVRTADNLNAELKVKETVVPILDGLQVLGFNLLTDVTSPTERHELKIKRITDGTGAELGFSHQQDRLLVRFPQPLKAGAPVEITFEYGGDFLQRPRGDRYWELSVGGAWYPQAEHLAEESYTFHGTVRTKGDWIAFLPGNQLRREKDGEWNLVETRTTTPICFATILGGKYFLEDETRDGITLHVASYASKGGTAVKVIKDQTFAVLNYYKAFMGPYPFKDFTIVEKNEWGYGQAPASMTYITREAFEQVSHVNNMQEIADFVGQYGGRLDFKTMDVRQVLAHEIAHQYWGGTVKMPSQEDQWVTESFAEYCSALYLREFKGKGHYQKMVAQWKASANEAKDFGPIPLANNLHPKEGFERFKARTGLLYAKGPMLLYALHQEMGDELFLTWMKSIQSNFKGKFLPTKRLFDLLSFVAKKDYTPFYDTYFWGTAMPPIK
jgi:hypothetical protein